MKQRRPALARAYLGVTVLIVVCLLVPLSSRSGWAAAGGKAAKRLGEIRYIYHGLSVRPPHRNLASGHYKQPLYNAYFLRTKRGQKGSIKFGDGTVLHINQNTDIVLKNAHLSQVQQGEVDQIVQPGTVHQVQAGTAVASAIGTEFDVREVKATKLTAHDRAQHKHARKAMAVITVVEGALVVDTPRGHVTVKTNQQTSVSPGEAPKAPIAVDARRSVGWTTSVPPVKNRKENIALDSNGGHILSASSVDQKGGTVQNLIDGHLDTGWETAKGDSKGAKAQVAFAGEGKYEVAGVLIDPSATGTIPAGDALKDFQIRSSVTGTDEKDFTTVYQGTAQASQGLQRFLFTKPVESRYIELVVLSSQGSPIKALDTAPADGQITVAEMEVVGVPNQNSIKARSGCVDNSTQLQCQNLTLDMMNAIRSAAGLPPLQLNLTLSNGTSFCIGAVGHSVHMSQTGNVNHDQFPDDVCVPYHKAGENVDTDDTGTLIEQLQAVQDYFMSEPHDSATCSKEINHACNILSPIFTQVGIGIYFANGHIWITELFIK